MGVARCGTLQRPFSLLSVFFLGVSVPLWLALNGLAKRLRRAFDLGGRHVEVGAGADRLRAGGVDEDAVLAEPAGHVLRGPEGRVDAEPDEVRLGLRRVQL